MDDCGISPWGISLESGLARLTIQFSRLSVLLCALHDYSYFFTNFPITPRVTDPSLPQVMPSLGCWVCIGCTSPPGPSAV